MGILNNMISTFLFLRNKSFNEIFNVDSAKTEIT